MGERFGPPFTKSDPYDRIPRPLLVGVVAVLSFLSAGLLMTVAELFYTPQSDWGGVFSSALTMAILHTAALVAVIELHKWHSPASGALNILYSLFPAVSLWFFVASLAAVQAMFVAVPVVLVATLVLELIQTGAVLEADTDWRTIFHWTTLVCYGFGGISGLAGVGMLWYQDVI